MRRVAAAGAAALAFLLCGGASALETSQFRWERTLRSAPGLAAFDPDGPMFAHAAEGFTDLRLLDAGGRQVPWRAAPQQSGGTEQRAHVLNAGREEGAAVALLDFGPPRVVRDRIDLDLPERPFVGRVEVFGSDDRRRFTRLSSTAIYDLRGAQPARSTAAVFPSSDFRYYRVRATGVARILGARAGAAPRAARLVPQKAEQRVTQRPRATVVAADLGFRNVPVDELHVGSSTPSFDRPVEVTGSNDGRTFFVLGGGRVFRVQGEERQTAVPLDASARFLRIRIDNGDDEPLRDLRVTLLARPRTVLVAPGFDPPYRVFYGAPLPAPEYDFAEQPPPSGEPQRATLGPERRAAPPRDTRSFVERNGWLVQAALALAAVVVAAVGIAVFRRKAV
jgi:hypothetical protein